MFKVEIKEQSKELSKREQLKVKDVSAAIKLDEATKEGPIEIVPVGYVVLAVHNDKAQDRPDYENYMVLDNAGDCYVTGSTAFFNGFMEIFSTMGPAGEEEEYKIKVFRKPSKNYTNKDFITCTII